METNYDKMVRKAPSIKLSLPRPQRPLHDALEDAKHYAGVCEVLKEEWGQEGAPSHAWIRCVLSVDVPRTDFCRAYAGLKNIRTAFGRRVLVMPVSLDHHEAEFCELIHMVDPLGQHEIELSFENRRVDGGTHILLAVESKESEDAIGLDILEALEAILRATLGNSALVNTRHTRHTSVAEGISGTISPNIHVYGLEEAARAEDEFTGNALQLISEGSMLPVQLQRRLMLGLRWANVAFKSHDLLSAWTALEILAGGHGTRVYRLLSKAYGEPSPGPQELAKRLGVQHVFDMRNAYAHEGATIYYSPSAASFMLALAHDLARSLVSLPAQKNAERLSNHHGGDLKKIICRTDAVNTKRKEQIQHKNA
jgi:hypothetical protein